VSNNYFRIAVHQDKNTKVHSTSWSNPWIEYLEKSNLKYEVINCFENGILEKLRSFNVLLWHFGNYIYKDMVFARSILYSAKQMGLKVFPNYNDAWHFDDKIAQMYILQSVNAPIPKSYVFYKNEDLYNWLRNFSEFPVVSKLKSGSGSHNVKLIKNRHELKKYANRMFSIGFSPAPSFKFKAISNLKSSKSKKDVISRLKRLPEFIRTLSGAREFPNEKGYVYLQEFIPSDGFDLKIVVVGDKLSYIGRNIRKGDFRASGGGDLFYNKELVTKDIITSAFETSDKLGFQCMGYDYVIDKRTGKGVIVEISYGFSHSALLQAGGYWDREFNWHNEPLNAPEEVLKNIILQVKQG